jgi:WD40 repeat protein
VATAGWDRTIRVWDLTSSLTEGYDHQILTLTGHDSRIVDIDISKNENYLASASQDGSVKLWDISPQGGKESLALINGPGPGTQAMVTLSLSPDGTRLAAANADLTPRVWDTITGDLLYKLVGHQDSVEWIEYSPDGELIATAGHDDSIRIWDALNGNFVASVDDHNCSYYFTGGYGCDLVFSPDGRRLAIVNTDGILVIFEVASLIGEYTKRPEPIIEIIDSEAEMMFDVSYSPDGNKIVSTSMNYAKVWDANNGELLHTLRGHSSSAYGAVYSPDGKHILTTSADETARIWDAESGELLKTLLGHSESVLQANYSRDGQRIATASTDGSVKLWDAQEGEELLTLRGHASGVGDVAFSPDGRLLYTASHDGTNRVFLLEIEELIALAKLRVSRALSKPECQKYLHVETCPEAVQ